MNENSYLIGQRWLSIAEPELGLGIIIEIPDKTLKVLFPTSGVTRLYNRKGAPLKRVTFNEGDKLKLVDGREIVVNKVNQKDGITYYVDDSETEHSESAVDDTTRFNNPEEKIFNAQIDDAGMYNLRYRTHQLKLDLIKKDVQGFIGPRVSLLPHQFYVANKVVKNIRHRALLADEVGLGKTIEAGLVIHSLLKRGQIERVAIVVPDSLTYQWFVEFYRKFSLSFSVINRETVLEPNSNPFVDNQLVIIGLGLLKGSEIARDLLGMAKFDMVVVDEAHQLKWTKEGPSIEFKIVEDLASRTKGLILLSATPQKRGSIGHFSRLKLIDPHKFSDFTKYQKDEEYFLGLSEEVQKILADQSMSENERESKINSLIDIHGPGRIVFRNSRKKMSDVFDFFPKRILIPERLELKLKVAPSFDDEQAITKVEEHKLIWLVDKLHNLRGEKVLLITRSKARVLFLEKKIKELSSNIKTAVFHSDLTLQARDRQAAYFAESDGADVLLCTEIGSEGRNFEFSANLVLFDLPLHPDLLEQRIGRLDRIGQRRDISIHVPYIANTFEERLFQFYSNGLGCFSNHSGAYGEVFELYKKTLKEYLEDSEKVDYEVFLKQVKESFIEAHQKIEEGKDLLIEQNSYHPATAQEIVERIKTEDKARELADYMETVFEQFGVESEALDELNTYIRPGDNMFIPSFPNLTEDGMSFTYNRARALSREDLQFLTWDHPMVTGIMELIIGGGFGNATVVERVAKKAGAKSFLEVNFLSESVAPRKLSPEKFYPPIPIRVLINSDGEDFSEKFKKQDIDEKVAPLGKSNYDLLKKLPKDKIKGLIKIAEDIAHKKQIEMSTLAIEKMKTAYTHDLERLNKLGEGEGAEAVELRERMSQLEDSFSKSTIYFDSIRLII